MNKNMLISFMKLYGDTQTDLAEYLGISYQRCNAKINQTGGAKFDMIEIGKIKRKYHMTAEQVDMTFFAVDVSCQDIEQ